MKTQRLIKLRQSWVWAEEWTSWRLQNNQNAARQYTVFWTATRSLYCSRTASLEHTGLMISPSASKISLRVRVCVVCVLLASMLGGRYDKWHSTRISALKICLEGKKHPFIDSLPVDSVPLSEMQWRAAEFLALGSLCTSGALYVFICFSLSWNAAISLFQFPAQSSAFLPPWHENKLRLSASACVWFQTPLSAITGWETAINCALETYNGLLQRWQNLYHITPLPIQAQMGSLFLITIQQ